MKIEDHRALVVPLGRCCCCRKDMIHNLEFDLPMQLDSLAMAGFEHGFCSDCWDNAGVNGRNLLHGIGRQVLADIMEWPELYGEEAKA